MTLIAALFITLGFNIWCGEMTRRWYITYLSSEQESVFWFKNKPPPPPLPPPPPMHRIIFIPPKNHEVQSFPTLSGFLVMYLPFLPQVFPLFPFSFDTVFGCFLCSPFYFKSTKAGRNLFNFLCSYFLSCCSSRDDKPLICITHENFFYTLKKVMFLSSIYCCSHAGLGAAPTQLKMILTGRMGSTRRDFTSSSSPPSSESGSPGPHGTKLFYFSTAVLQI